MGSKARLTILTDSRKKKKIYAGTHADRHSFYIRVRLIWRKQCLNRCEVFFSNFIFAHFVAVLCTNHRLPDTNRFINMQIYTIVIFGVYRINSQGTIKSIEHIRPILALSASNVPIPWNNSNKSHSQKKKNCSVICERQFCVRYFY